ncbi:hypothetical protein P280DRAFT_533778 [Massarina eburnea CBS 473.64]|uniref:WSC domain-containing protein n=1 Tax=Massarina eburnea CBS 473.64 TaxID=1395130 RepID=A0A6A6RM51_9PLEO|nr:hypothetical protein P280DRAFT_533778 [Massarina eburnea CBS 473.64]
MAQPRRNRLLLQLQRQQQSDMRKLQSTFGLVAILKDILPTSDNLWMDKCTDQQNYHMAANVNGSELTTETCLEACGSRGFPYAGREYGQEYYCGVQYDYSPQPQVHRIEGSLHCNATETCGGGNVNGRLNMYQAPDFLAPSRSNLAPAPSTSAPAPSTSAPSPSTSAPSPSTSAPSPSTSAPSPSTSAPSPSHLAPALSNSAPNSAPSPPSLASSSRAPQSSSAPLPSTPPPSPSSTNTPPSTPIPSPPKASCNPPTYWTPTTPTNTYSPPPYTCTKSSKPPPALTNTCICATPA